MNKDNLSRCILPCCVTLLFFLVVGLEAKALGQELSLDAPAFSVAPKTLLEYAGGVPKQKNANVIVLLDEERDTIDEQGRAKQIAHTIYRVDTAKGVETWASASSTYWPWYQKRPLIRARVITPDGVQHDLDPKTLSDLAVKDDDENVYSDEHSYEGPLPAVAIGAVVEEEIVNEDTAPYFQGVWSTAYLIGRNEPVMRTKIIVETPKSLPLHYKTQLAPEIKVKTVENPASTTYSFEYGATEAFDSQPMLPPDVPRYASVYVTTASSWKDLAARYWKIAEPKIRPDEVKPLVAEIRSKDRNAIAKLLAKVHADVRYTGLEFGDAGITPQPPSETLKRKYGDCKDKATLLVSMLRAIGIEANLALLNSGEGRDVQAEVPGMGWFNHAIVYVPSEDLFIDATAQYSRVGELPSEDQGRWALVIAEDTTELKRIPQQPSSSNRTVETREFYLQDYGPARIVETTEWFGEREAYYRSSYSGGEGKDYKKGLDGYAEDVYLGESVSKYEHGDVADLSKPFWLRIEIPKGRRGNTELTDAAVAIRLADMVSGQIPDEIQKDPEHSDDEASASSDENRRTPRTADWYLGELHRTEWRYRVVPPVGYKSRGLPERKTVQFGPAVLKQEFKAAADGSVEASISFDMVKRRYTNAEVVELRKALKQFRNGGVIFINFDFAADTLLQQGKVREALAAYRKLAVDEPSKAIHRVRLARAYLSAGLGDMSRHEAEAAVKMDPTSAVAYGTLGWVLQHDLVGRRFTKGFDPAGAAAAYKKARDLDPKEPNYAFSLGESLEYDAEGERYVGRVNLDQVISVYRELKKNEKADVNSVNEHLFYALAYARRFAELKDLLSEAGNTPVTRTMRTMVAAGLNGGPAGVRTAGEIASDEKSKSDALAGAGTIAMRMRMYPEAAEMLSVAATGQPNASSMANLAQLLKRTQKHEELPANDNDPGNVVLRALILGNDPVRRSQVGGLMSRALHELPADYVSNLLRRHWTIKFRSELPEVVLLDITVAMLKTSVEGEDATGYRVSVQSPGVNTQHVFVVRENGALKILCENEDLAPLGQEVLDRLGRGDLKGAKVLLDWAREERKLVGGEDPYAGPAFARVWSKGNEADPVAMRRAAIVLVCSAPMAARPYLSELKAAREKASGDSERAKMDEALMLAYYNSLAYSEGEAVVTGMLERTESAALFRALAEAKTRQKKWEELAKLIQQHKGKLDDDTTVPLVEAQAYLAQKKPAKAMEVLKTLIDSGKGDAMSVNLYGWAAVIAGDVKPELIEIVQQTVQQPKNQQYAILHTLGCMYAVAGRPRQAKEVLLEAMKRDGSVDEPESTIWYGFGLLAESYGEMEAAAKLYAKVDKPLYYQSEQETTYTLAQERLVLLGKNVGKSAAAK